MREENKMYVEKWIRLMAGTFVLVSLTLGYVHSAYWHIFTAFVGLNLIQSVVTNWCLAETLLRKAGAKDKAACC